jgi:SPP1 family phage portal protein
MQLQKTDKTTLTSEDILKYMEDYERAQVKEFDKLWQYYLGANTAIMGRKSPGPNEPDNKVPIPYGRKLIKSFTGYAYRPRYITYKPVDPKTDDKPDGEDVPEKKTATPAEVYIGQLQETFNLNNEQLLTEWAGRNTGIFGVAYELMYVDKSDKIQTQPVNSETSIIAEPRFCKIDPREMILIYDYSLSPKKVVAIHFYRLTTDHYKASVYYPDHIELYDRKREENSGKWTLISAGVEPNFFGEVPVIAYYFGDEMLSIIKPVLPLIDAYDALISDSMNESDKFAEAYLVMKDFGITDPTKKKEPGMFDRALANLKQKKVFEHVPKDAEISYLTKDVPTPQLQMMFERVVGEIHKQSHIPDFTGEKFAGASGIAIQRLLFDFENMVSSAEADFDLGLMERIRLITLLYGKAGRMVGTPDMISISHKRNIPDDLKQFADTALTMKNAGFSRYIVADVMPDDIIPDVEEELARQDEDSKAMMPDISAIPEVEEGENPVDDATGKNPFEKKPFGGKNE